MKFSELKKGMRIEYSDMKGTVVDLDLHRGACKVCFDDGRSGIYSDSIKYFVEVPDVYANVTPRTVTEAIKYANSLLPKRDDKAEEMRFFRSVPQGSCPCGIVRSQCRYHA